MRTCINTFVFYLYYFWWIFFLDWFHGLRAEIWSRVYNSLSEIDRVNIQYHAISIILYTCYSGVLCVKYNLLSMSTCI